MSKDSLIGFDNLFDLVNRVPSVSEGYPKYDIIEIDEEKIRLDLAVAGFSKDDIKIHVEKNKLTIEGDNSQTKSELRYIHSGIAKRSFKRVFTLHDYIQVENAEFINGILQINMKTVIPEEKKPKMIAIS